MHKEFGQVFPQIGLSKEAASALGSARVERLRLSPDKKNLRVDLLAGQIIQKPHLWEAQAQLEQALYPHRDGQVRIRERFQLPDTYTPRSLWEEYKDSFFRELFDYSRVLYTALFKARQEWVEGRRLVFWLEENDFLRQKQEELEKILFQVFVERCGADMELAIAFEAPARLRAEPEMEFVDRPAAPRAEADAAEPVSKAPARKGRRSAQPKDPSLLYGRDVSGAAVAMDSLHEGYEEVVLQGQIIGLDRRDLKSGKLLCILTISDFSDSIRAKLFLDPPGELALAEGDFIRIKGWLQMDAFEKELVLLRVRGIRKIEDFRPRRRDNAPRKRVELHMHTKMSDMDGVSDVGEMVRRAYGFGHPAVAITDHGAVQGFTDGYKEWKKLWGKAKERAKAEGKEPPSQDEFFKIIYGCEAYLVDDLLQICNGERGQDLDGDFVVFDLETTGFSPVKNKIIEIGAVRIRRGRIEGEFSALIYPQEPIPYAIEQLTGINNAMLADKPLIEEVLPQFLDFVRDAVLVAHNAGFDMSFLQQKAADMGLDGRRTYVDTVELARVLLPKLGRHKLDMVAKALGISLENHHRAVDDARATAEIFLRFGEMLRERGAHTLADINALGDGSADRVKKKPSYHGILLAKNDLGRINLYRLVSQSHVEYFHKHPRIPLSLLRKYREGMLVGSACEAGMLYRALLDGASPAQLERIVSIYDYLEIQPLENNSFMVDSPKIRNVESLEDIRRLNRAVVELGEQYGKPVVATCDAHFADPMDGIYRRIIMAGKGFDDGDAQPPLFLRTTEEMLEEFAYLGPEKAMEVVVDNPRRISAMVEPISPLRPDKCVPVIEDSDKTLRNICMEKARSIYGSPLPEPVEARLERELGSIIQNGFAVMYIIAQKLVWKSVEDGYLVGSRGSVGSSLAATMAGITEVNPLPPHYYCPHCHYCEFDSERVRAYGGRCGADMPDADCPDCGRPLAKEGFDIPFETFLGFKGDKEPDIDLNFSGEYQARAHRYTEEIFGKGQTFRAGTIGTLADKTAYGFVKKYFEERDVQKRGAELDRLAKACTGIRRSTGQHPGGIVVLPVGQDINSFTPVQKPANDMETDTITTHFDYHSIDHNLLKLDILGHDDPTMIRMLQDLTGLDPVSIPLDDKGVMSLFQNTKALGIEPEQIGGCALGALGIPEFGTDFAMQMLIDAAPTSFSDLVRIAGLAHGTDVWLGNAKDLILSGQATISTAICTRDDIMVYLISMGVESSLAFTIMESVRKGKGLLPDWEEAMRRHQVPEWYIESCKKIKYMFPKAHAAAYVMMAWRIAYFKIHHPLAYYTAYFSIRAKAFSYEKMCLGPEALAGHMEEFRRMENPGNKEKDSYSDMRIVQEMHARGYAFLPIDLFRARAERFQILEGRIMPSLNSIEGLGEKAAASIEAAAGEGAFLSKEDFRIRAKVSKTVVEMLDKLGILGDLPMSNQISIFDSLALASD